ncbi:MAG: hypothetical protein WCV67_21400 [Victivallaceae bacterium]
MCGCAWSVRFRQERSLASDAAIPAASGHPVKVGGARAISLYEDYADYRKCGLRR